MKVRIESIGHFDLEMAVIAIGLIMMTIPAMMIYVFILILPKVLAWLLAFGL